MTKVHDFDKQLTLGLAGEKLFLKYWPHPLRRNPDLRGVDFSDSKGNIIELKTDLYGIDTGNFFIERWSDYINKKPGGPWQALEKGATCWVYFYPAQATWFVIQNLKGFVAHLEEQWPSPYMHNIRNKGWTTQGFLVKRNAVEQFTEEYGVPMSTREKNRFIKKAP